MADGKTLKVQVAIGYSSWPRGMEQSIVMLENDILLRSPVDFYFRSKMAPEYICVHCINDNVRTGNEEILKRVNI